MNEMQKELFPIMGKFSDIAKYQEYVFKKIHGYALIRQKY